MVFEIYIPRGKESDRNKPAIVSLSKDFIALNKISREKLNTDRVELAYDRDSEVIRIKASPEGQAIKKTRVFSRGF